MPHEIDAELMDKGEMVRGKVVNITEPVLRPMLDMRELKVLEALDRQTYASHPHRVAFMTQDEYDYMVGLLENLADDIGELDIEALLVTLRKAVEV